MFYVLIYQNMEVLFSQTRIPSSSEIHKQKKSSRKMMQYIKRFIIFLSFLYAIAEILQLFLILLVGYSMEDFNIQLIVSSNIVILIVNVHGAMNYCR